MRALAILALVLLPSLALAQGMANCQSPSASCQAKKFLLAAGSNLILNYPTSTDTIRASTASAGMLLNSGVNNSGANSAFSFTTTNTLTGNTLIFNYGNGASQVGAINNAGKVFSADTFEAFATTSTPGNPVPAVHGAQTHAVQSIEFGNSAATAGVLAVTFATAFSSAPACICTGNNATATGCVISTTQTTTGVSFKFNAGTDTINWFCIGQK